MCFESENSCMLRYTTSICDFVMFHYIFNFFGPSGELDLKECWLCSISDFGVACLYVPLEEAFALRILICTLSLCLLWAMGMLWVLLFLIPCVKKSIFTIAEQFLLWKWFWKFTTQLGKWKTAIKDIKLTLCYLLFPWER